MQTLALILLVATAQLARAGESPACVDLLTQRLIRSRSLDAIADYVAQEDRICRPRLIRATERASVVASLDELTRMLERQRVDYVVLGSHPRSNFAAARDLLGERTASRVADLGAQLASLIPLPYGHWVLLIDLTDLAESLETPTLENRRFWQHAHSISSKQPPVQPWSLAIFATHAQLPNVKANTPPRLTDRAGRPVRVVMTDLTDRRGRAMHWGGRPR